MRDANLSVLSLIRSIDFITSNVMGGLYVPTGSRRIKFEYFELLKQLSRTSPEIVGGVSLPGVAAANNAGFVVVDKQPARTMERPANAVQLKKAFICESQTPKECTALGCS
jgi:hypothetical protein